VRRRRTDRLHVRTLGPREREALRRVEQRPGITVAELADEMDVTMNRARHYVRRLEAGRVRREQWRSD
jgi:predicted ArsR family transcriptional regulator